MPRVKPFGYWDTAETVRTLRIHTDSGNIPAKYGLHSVEATAVAVMQRLAAGVITVSFRPPGLGLFGIEIGFWDLECSVSVFDRGFLDYGDDAMICMAMPDGAVIPMPLPAGLLLWGAGVLAAFEYDAREGERAETSQIEPHQAIICPGSATPTAPETPPKSRPPTDAAVLDWLRQRRSLAGQVSAIGEKADWAAANLDLPGLTRDRLRELKKIAFPELQRGPGRPRKPQK